MTTNCEKGPQCAICKIVEGKTLLPPSTAKLSEYRHVAS